ncbi:MAG TPA: sensor histidine kinase [Pseudonocardiaceae bacterium]|nr:sensor histidine kinase [Pseudonocardiaceae bacterium]
MTSDGRTRTAWLAGSLCGVAVVGVATAVTATVLAGRDFGYALNSFAVTNSLMGVTFSACGLLIAWHRPRNPIGWLLLADGIGHAMSAATGALADYGVRAGWPVGLERTLVTVFAYAWPWSIGLFLPLILQLFPTGRPVGRGWRWVAVATVVTAPLFVLEMGLSPTRLVPGITGYLTLGSYRDVTWLWTVSEVRLLLAVLAGLVSLGVRYRRGDDVLRRQLLWPLLAGLILLVLTTPWALVTGTPVYVLFSIPLVPVAMTIAIVRHGLLDIRLVVSRAVLYALLTALVIGAYLGLVVVFDRLLSRGAGGSALATVVIAIGFNPVRVRLQTVVDRLLYGDRADPMRAVIRVGARLGTGLPGVVAALREALRMPFAALRVRGVEVAAAGVTPVLLHTIPLSYGGDRVGELVVGLRRGERRLGRDDRAVLELLAAPLSVAVHAVGLSQELQASREAIVVAREEERRRLRRDLHDGLGPILTGVTYKADAAGNLLATDPDSTRRLLAELRTETGQAIDDIRRLVHDLRPPALDDLGLAGAIRQRAAQLDRDGVAVHVDAPELPPLPAAVEAAAYRIAVEALTNAVRHAGAARIDVRMRADDGLRIEVRDNGQVRPGTWSPGVGLRSMRERAAELGGTCTAGPGAAGGLVVATLPLAAP